MKLPRVMVIDDEPQMTKFLKILLEEDAGCEVVTFNDPVSAFEHLREKEFDAISLDHRMPKMTGMSLLKLLRSTPGPNQNTPVLIFTGFREEAESQREATLEHVLFIEKPIEDERYLRNLKIVLQMKKEARAAA